MFVVNATGFPLPTYQWKLNGAGLPGQTSAMLVISNAQPTDAGTYTVDVINSVATVTSLPAQLAVQGPAVTPLALSNLQWNGTAWTFACSGPAQTNYVIWASTDLATWVPLQTNFSASGTVQVIDSASNIGTRFYRATLSP